ncbi:SNW/SKI-interacting protein A [Ziziphus jujuba]|uniref:SNW/SKI-interacting protein A n=1 Tax=Ziziphus jujuba TaxID=326968 RepID=A0ABM3I3Z2_ZIZJJ|nr:SNW/SKI-interacting protein A [Ziziphus jujuba]
MEMRLKDCRDRFSIPPYRRRWGFVPRTIQDFGDGGSFPEILILQYPLDMGRELRQQQCSNVVKHPNNNNIVNSQYADIVPKILKVDNHNHVVYDGDFEQEDYEIQIQETTKETKVALERTMSMRSNILNYPKYPSNSKFIKYKPSSSSSSSGAINAKERIVEVVDVSVADPVEPPKFKHKKLPYPSSSASSPPVPVLHSPPRTLTVEDQENWKIPPCISNWKNPKGYAIPLHKRCLVANYDDVQINDNFAKLSEALYVSEHKAREAVALRSKLDEEISMKEKERKEQELRLLAMKARSSSNGYHSQSQGREEEKLQRDKIREERRQERKRERRLEAKDVAMRKRSKNTKESDRDMNEKVALGMAYSGEGRGGEIMYDQRLFNQEKGIESGFANDDDIYNLYERGLFGAQPTMSSLYRPKKKGLFEDAVGPRDGPVKFQKADDLFGLDQFMKEVDKGMKGAADF